MCSAVDAAWASWGSWGSCSKTCGGGVSPKWQLVDFAFNFKLSAIQTQSRSRDCNTAQYGGSPAICTIAETASQSCNTNTCRTFLFVVNDSFLCQGIVLSLLLYQAFYGPAELTNISPSCGCLLGCMGLLGQLHRNMWWRGENLTIKQNSEF